MTPAQAVSEALLTALKATEYRLTHPYGDGGVYDIAPDFIAALPAEAAVVTVESLAAALRQVFAFTERHGDQREAVALGGHDAIAAALIAAHKEAR